MKAVQKTALGLGLIALVAGCGSREEILPGQRIDIRAPLVNAVAATPERPGPAVRTVTAVALPPAVETLLRKAAAHREANVGAQSRVNV